ncbi:MAG: class I SAM-dependent methyltransferase, partial [Actinomycetota bacterium]|nr:class I SAM-dependent methyltransferase [Actinomycetota bacterium]
MSEEAELRRLLAEAEARPLGGWDFGWLGDRMRSGELPWDFTAIVVERARRSPDLLDLGTGGGEWLASLPHRPPRTVATEGWA